MVRLEGQEFPTPVIFTEAAEPILPGVVTLEETLLAVDPVAGRLVPANALRLQPRERRRAQLDWNARHGMFHPGSKASCGQAGADQNGQPLVTDQVASLNVQKSR